FTELGNYTLQAKFENVTYRNKNYKASESENVTLTIQEEGKPSYPGHNPPSEYWTRPVDSQLREWYGIMGSWLQKPQNLHAPHNDAPKSAHILWSMPNGDTLGGLAGGDNGMSSFQAGDAYEGKFVNSVILAGILYYNKGYNSNSGVAPYTEENPMQTLVAVNMRTGKVLWEKSYTTLSNGRINQGQILNFFSENNRGSHAYLWIGSSGTMYALSPTTGEHVYTMTNVPSGTIYFGPNGEMLKYTVVNIGTTADPNYQVRQWNSTHVVNYGQFSSTQDSWANNVHTRSTSGGARSFDAARTGYDLNMTIGANNPGTLQVAFPGDRLIYATSWATAANLATDHSVVDGASIFLTGIGLDLDNQGQTLFRREFKAPSDWVGLESFGSRPGIQPANTMAQSVWSAFSSDPYVGIFWVKELRVHYAFSLESGRLLYTTEPQIYADAWSDTVGLSYGPEKLIVNGKLYAAGVGGIVYCYDAANGTKLWDYPVTDKYMESYHGENWWTVPLFISDGMLYVGHMVHSGQIPLSRGAPFLALDAETGDLVWEIDGAFRQTRWGGRAILGDSIIATYDVYDQQIYAIGKGPAATTISAPNVAVTAGTKAVISGTVMDVSPGTEQDEIELRFSNGVPAVSDESMSEWMLHVYKQFPAPMDVKGIEVSIGAYDPDGDWIELGKATTDVTGRYSFTWTPSKAGEYMIYAVSADTASYYSDYATTTIAVSDAPVEKTTPAYEWYIIGMGIAIIAVVLIVGLLLLLKKK
ncbi:MAG: PQQ-binding-like beta-propeller repeat protein, partial [Nitrososphaerota archaeon]|nr:PQQ-binding-like beta-propeller repeat protein [Nitrososphaerota archaeon]